MPEVSRRYTFDPSGSTVSICTHGYPDPQWGGGAGPVAHPVACVSNATRHALGLTGDPPPIAGCVQLASANSGTAPGEPAEVFGRQRTRPSSAGPSLHG